MTGVHSDESMGTSQKRPCRRQSRGTIVGHKAVFFDLEPSEKNSRSVKLSRLPDREGMYGNCQVKSGQPARALKCAERSTGISWHSKKRSRKNFSTVRAGDLVPGTERTYVQECLRHDPGRGSTASHRRKNILEESFERHRMRLEF